MDSFDIDVSVIKCMTHCTCIFVRKMKKCYQLLNTIHKTDIKTKRQQLDDVSEFLFINSYLMATATDEIN